MVSMMCNFVRGSSVQQPDVSHEMLQYRQGPNGSVQVIETWCVTRPDGRVFLHVPPDGLEITPGTELAVLQALFKAARQC
jgi:hypothetical protein